jgi:hypothetical protein
VSCQAAQVPLVVDPTPPRLEIAGVGLRAGALVAQLAVAGGAGLLQQPRLGIRVGAGGVGDHGDLLGRQLTSPGGVGGCRQILQSPCRVERVPGLVDRRARRARQLMCC